MDPIAMLIGAGVFFVGYALGRIGRPPRVSKPKDPMMCLCGHMKAFHDAENGCMAHMPKDWANNRTCRCLAFVSQAPELLIDWNKELGS